MTTRLAICDDCGQECDPYNLFRCALSQPWDERHHCPECVRDCGPCRDEAAIEWRAEHG